MPEIVPIITAIISAVGVGTSIYSIANRPGNPPTTSTPATTPAQNATTATNTRTAQEAALSEQLPGLQAQTGGSLSPDALLELSQLLSGQAGQPGIGGSVQDLLAKINPNSSAAGSGLTPGGAFG